MCLCLAVFRVYAVKWQSLRGSYKDGGILGMLSGHNPCGIHRASQTYTNGAQLLSLASWSQKNHVWVTHVCRQNRGETFSTWCSLLTLGGCAGVGHNTAHVRWHHLPHSPMSNFQSFLIPEYPEYDHFFFSKAHKSENLSVLFISLIKHDSLHCC